MSSACGTTLRQRTHKCPRTKIPIISSMNVNKINFPESLFNFKIETNLDKIISIMMENDLKIEIKEK